MDKKIIMMILLSILGVTGGSIGVYHVNKDSNPANKKIKLGILGSLIAISLLGLVYSGVQIGGGKNAVLNKMKTVKVTPTNVSAKIEPPNTVPAGNVNAPVVTNNA
jgi:hypothetical protein